MTGRAQRIWLVGMMGSGKSTVGASLAQLLAWDAVDADDIVEARVGQTIAAFWREHGEPAFRAVESEVIADLAAGPEGRVISVGGGAVLDAANREAIAAGGYVVWLRAEPTLLLDRVGPGASRPALGGDPLVNLARIDAARRPLYGEVADLILDVDGLAPAEAARQILRSVEGVLVRA